MRPIVSNETTKKIILLLLYLASLLASSSSQLLVLPSSSSSNQTALILSERKSIVTNDRLKSVMGSTDDGIDTLRIIRAYATSIYLQCPLQSKLTNEVISIHQIRWINEIDDFSKPDSAVVVSAHNLITSAQINLQLNERITYVSCGNALIWLHNKLMLSI